MSDVHEAICYKQCWKLYGLDKEKFEKCLDECLNVEEEEEEPTLYTYKVKLYQDAEPFDEMEGENLKELLEKATEKYTGTYTISIYRNDTYIGEIIVEDDCPEVRDIVDATPEEVKAIIEVGGAPHIPEYHLKEMVLELAKKLAETTKEKIIKIRGYVIDLEREIIVPEDYVKYYY